MWCGKCQADVAAEVSPDNQRVSCTTCGALLSTIDLPPARPVAEKLGDRTKDARELLQRWSSGQVLDPFGPLPNTPIPPAPPSVPVQNDAASVNESTEVAPERKPETAAFDSPVPRVMEVARDLGFERALPQILNPLAAVEEPSSPPIPPKLSPLVAPLDAGLSAPLIVPTPFVASAPANSFHRIDAAHPADHFGTAKQEVAPSEQSVGPFPSKPVATESKREARRPIVWFPTWDPSVWRTESNMSGSWSSIAGQFLAYAGVLGLTAGACLVVWSYFGGPANYAPMGWLLATAGQMLLFFGVVTLVSGGLEQTTEQVTKRIEQLGDHIIRIEQAAREISLRGAIPPAHFGQEHDSAQSPRLAASRDERSVVEEQSGR